MKPGRRAARLVALAMLGGLLEYNAMCFGFQFLYLLAAVLYAAAWVSTRLPARGSAPGAVPANGP